VGKSLKDWIQGQAVHADNLWAAEVCSAEATELPVWKRPPVSVANGICHPNGTGSRVKWFTQIYADKSRRWARGLWGAVVLGSGACFWALKDWIPGQARDDTAMGSVGDLFRSWVFSYFYARLIRIICVICGCFFQKTGSRLKRFSQIYADKSRRLPRIGIMGVQDLPLDLRAAPLSLSCREY